MIGWNVRIYQERSFEEKKCIPNYIICSVPNQILKFGRHVYHCNESKEEIMEMLLQLVSNFGCNSSLAAYFLCRGFYANYVANGHNISHLRQRLFLKVF
jgi:hypothetical protein